jgi:hypothetical protein
MMEKTYFSTIDGTELAWPVFRQQQDTGWRCREAADCR